SNDISKLTAISQVDTDGINIQLMQLANQVSQLKFKVNNDNNIALAPNDKGATAVSGSVTDWKQNLQHNLNAFLSKFVTIKKQDITLDCQPQPESKLNPACHLLQGLQAQQQQHYLQENKRLQQLLAAGAAVHHQQQAYTTALHNVSNWVTTYFDEQDQLTQAMLKTLEQLSRQSIDNQHVPDNLTSAPLLEKLMRTRVRSVLTEQPQSSQTGG